MIDVLAHRARQLAARRTDAELPATDEIVVLTVRLNDERFALDVGTIAHVVPLGRVTPVPGTGPAWVGVMALKGEVIALFEMARLLGVPTEAAPNVDVGYVLILKHAVARIGVQVAGVEQIVRARREGPLVRIGEETCVLIEDLERALAPYIYGDGQ